MISSILKTAGLIALLFGAWVLFTVQSGKDTGAGKLIDKVSTLKTKVISTVKPSNDNKESKLESVKCIAEPENLDGNAEDVLKEKTTLLTKSENKENASTDDTGEMFNTKTILREKQAERTTAKNESENHLDTDGEEPTDMQLQSAQKRLAESIMKLETTINGFWRR